MMAEVAVEAAVRVHLAAKVREVLHDQRLPFKRKPKNPYPKRQGNYSADTFA